MHQLQTDASYKIVAPVTLVEGAVAVLRHHLDSQAFNTLDTLPPVVVLEFEDFSFHHDSAVPLPCLPSQPDEDVSTEVFWEDRQVMRGARACHRNTYNRFKEEQPPEPEAEDPRLRLAMVLLAVAYKFLETNTDYALLVAGHTDTSGESQVNFSLSDLRSANVLALLEGDADTWVDICQRRSKVEDYQRIFRHYAQANLWNCDPGPVDNVEGQLTRQAVRQFQSKYNEVFAQSIAVDGAVGPQTWRAIFDVYMDELTRLLDVDTQALDSFRAEIRFIDPDHKTIGCGEQIPIAELQRDNYRSAENRRVELLFFHSTRPPDLSAHLDGGEIRSGAAGRESSEIYSSAIHWHLQPLWWEAKPPSDSYSPRFEIVPIEEDLEDLYDEPDSETYDTEHPQTPDLGADDDPWDFLEFFNDHHPGVGGGREAQKERAA